MERTTREMTFEEEAFFYEKEARAEFAKETGNGDCSTVNGILRRGMRIIRKARQEIASREVVRCKDCKHRGEFRCPYTRFTPWSGLYDPTKDDDFCSYGERREGE